MSSNKVKVAVRVRPFNKRELDLKTDCVVSLDNNQVVLQPHEATLDNKDNGTSSRKACKSFAFDHCFSSFKNDNSNNNNNNNSDSNSNDNDNVDDGQDEVFRKLGLDILENAFDGYNACIFAYGQTGSGKSYTMLGSQSSQGIIPRLCDALFEGIAKKSEEEQNGAWQAKVEVSYMEIYNEKVHDLLDPNQSRHGLKVREHNVLGPYVDGLSQLAVISYQEIEDLMLEGNKSRTVAATNMNNESSRSHAVFTVVLTQTLTDGESGIAGEKVSRISLVDLAGSERAVKTGAVGDRLKEGSNINKSLTTLGLVISKLADQSAQSGGGKAKKDTSFVPYRDSTLTWLLKDNLGGNSKTVMVATVSPAADNYEETLSTLRYADRAKRIVNHAVVNEDPNARIIRELRAEVDALKEMLKHASQPDVLREKLSENEKLMKEISLTWEEKLQKTGQTQEDRRHALERAGISVQSSGIKVEKDKYFLVNLNADPALNELLVYYLKQPMGVTRVGRGGGEEEVDIQLSGVGIQDRHCEIDLLEEGGELLLRPLPGARTCVNGAEVTQETPLRNGDRILWGSNHFFRVNCPKGPNECLSDPTTPAAPFDWRMAQEEVMAADLSKNDPLRSAIARLERQHETDKAAALDRQRKEYERHFRELRSYMSPSTPYPPYPPMADPLARTAAQGPMMQQQQQQQVGTPTQQGVVGRGASAGVTPSTPMTMSRLEKWGQERDETFKRSLSKLREDLVYANGLAREANLFAEDRGKDVRFGVTLQIPPYNLSPNRRPGGFVSEPAILVRRRGKGAQVWPVEKLDLKLIEMRALSNLPDDPDCPPMPDPLGEGAISDGHSLIGVANVFLACLFHDVKFDYHTPIISQQGAVAGRLRVQIEHVRGSLPHPNTDIMNQSVSSSSGGGGLVRSFTMGPGLLPASSSNLSEVSASSSVSSSSDASRTSSVAGDDSITVRVTVKEATRLPPSLSHFVFCQYTLWGDDDEEEPTVVPPASGGDATFGEDGENVNGSTRTKRRINGEERKRISCCRFEHSQDFLLPVTEELLDYCAEGALSIEVYGHRKPTYPAHTSNGHGVYQGEHGENGFIREGEEERVEEDVKEEEQQEREEEVVQWTEEEQQAKARSLADRWSELTRKLELEVEVQELGENGEYAPVEVQPRTDVGTGGVLQLRQGQQRRVVVSVRPQRQEGKNASRGICGSLPLICDSVTSVSVGCPCVRSKLQKPLDSYQEEDLNQLRRKWSEALGRRRDYLDAQIQKYVNKTDKSEAEKERERSLVDQWVCLTEERNSVMVPAAGSGVPGAPADWEPPDGMEAHSPVIFLDLNADDLSTGCDDSMELPTFGSNSILPKEHGGKFIPLPVISFLEDDVGAVCTWDSSVHDSLCLNRVTPTNERAYLIVKCLVRLSHPAPMNLVLRKRVCFNVYKRHSLTDKIRRKMGHTSSITSLGVVYEIVSNIPKASEELEDRESLAVMAASGLQQDCEVENNESNGNNSCNDSLDDSFGHMDFMEQYTQGVSAVDTILTLDRLRQSVAVKELLRNSYIKPPTAANTATNSAAAATSTSSSSSQSQFMRKTVSVPNFSHVTSSFSLENISGFLRSSDAGQQQHQQQQSTIAEDDRDEEDERANAAIESASSSASTCASRPTSLNLDFCLNNGREQQQQHQQPTATTTATATFTCTTTTSSALNGSKMPRGSSSSSSSSSSCNGEGSVGANNSNKTKMMTTLAEEEDHNEEEEEKVIHGTDTLDHRHGTNDPQENQSHITTAEKGPLSGTTASNISSYQQNGHSSGDLKPSTPPPSEVVATATFEETKCKLRNQCTSNQTTVREEEEESFNPAISSDNKSDNGLETNEDDSSICSSSSVNNSVMTKSMPPPASSSAVLSPEVTSNVPAWMTVGESVQVRPSYSTGVVAYVGATEFAAGVWVGVELDTPTGKNDGSVQGVRYFDCAARRGVFVRPDKVQLDKRGRLMQSRTSEGGGGRRIMSSSVSSGSLSAMLKSDVGKKQQANGVGRGVKGGSSGRKSSVTMASGHRPGGQKR